MEASQKQMQHKCLLRRDRREKNNNEVVLTQPAQVAQGAKAQSINSMVPKMTQKPTKVTTTKTVRKKEIKLTSYVFDAVYFQELVPSGMLEKTKPVLDTSCKCYVSDGNQEDVKETKYFQTEDGQQVLNNVVNCATNAILIWSSNNNMCKDLVGFAFNFGNSLSSINGSDPISTHSRILYLPLSDPGMTSP
ncbi:hypothetical protein DSO57_1027767 [Entomophthora muscae]|uniref:Uncharacterized protein n=1 Tax=Entomophthora muscae TaxID=34485 RepID=A0ACC2S3M4_9FUNG|nr:hypothetical protein DSO57_1027767 [Entomophthora muscae]